MHPKFVLRAVILAVLVALATCQECSHEDKEGYIIDVHTSEKNGAVFMSDAKTLTKESCQNACCNLEEDTLDDGSLARCNLAVFHSSSEIQSKSKNCFLVFCPSKNSCHLTRVKGFTSSYVTHTQVPETTDPEVLSNQPPRPKFYRPDSPPINSHKLFRRSHADGKPGSSMGGAAKQAETLLETAKKLVDAGAGSSSSQADKQVALQEGNLLSALAQDALGTMQKRAKAAKKKPKLITTPKISVKTTGKKPQQTTSSSATAPLVKVTTHGPAAKQTTTQSSQTESPKLKMTSPSPKEGTPTSARLAGMQGSTRPLSTPQMPVLTPASTNPAISPLLAKSTSSGNTTPHLVLGTSPSGNPQSTTLAHLQGTTQHQVTSPPSTEVPSSGSSDSRASEPSRTEPVTSSSTEPLSDDTALHSSSSVNKAYATSPPSTPSNYSVTTEPSVENNQQTKPQVAVQSLLQSKAVNNSPPQNTSPQPPPPTPPSITTSNSPAQFVSVPPSPSPAVTDQSHPASPTAPKLPVTNQSHTVMDVGLPTGQGAETTEASTLLPEINSTLPLSTREPTPSPDDASSESTSSISTNSSKDLVPSSPMDFLGENSALNQTNLSAADQQDSEDEDDSSMKSIIASNGALIAALCFGVIFLLAVVVLLGKHWYEAYQRRHYSKVDYLINGMYN